MVACLVLTRAACSESRTRPAPGRIAVDPADVDFGTVTRAPIPFHRKKVIIWNGLDHAVVMRRVEKTEGMSVQLAMGRLVAAGGQNEIILTFDARERSGPFEGTVTILWEDDTDPLRIPVRAAVEAGEMAKLTGPQLEIVGPGDWNFGTIQRQAVEFKDFIVRNAGTEPLVIDSVETHCGCVQGWVEQNTVLPGHTLPIHVRVTASVYPGKTPRKTVTVVTNDPDTPVTTFIVYGVIVDSFTIEPAPVEFGEIEPGTSPELPVIVRAQDTEPVRAAEVTISADMIRVERHPEKEVDDVVAALTLRPAPDAPLGPFDLRLTVAFDPATGLTPAVVPVRGTVGAALAVVPTAVNFGLVREQQVYTRRLHVPDVPDVSTLRVESQVTYLSATVVQDGPHARIDLTYAPRQGMGDVTGSLLVTDDATGRTRLVPVALRFERDSVGS